MGLTGFNYARRLAALKTEIAFDDLAYDQANEILQDGHLAAELTETATEMMAEGAPDAVGPSSVESGTFYEVRFAELKELGWQQLKQMLEDYNLPTEKPPDQTWAEFAIPALIQYEQESRT